MNQWTCLSSTGMLEERNCSWTIMGSGVGDRVKIFGWLQLFRLRSKQPALILICFCLSIAVPVPQCWNNGILILCCPGTWLKMKSCTPMSCNSSGPFPGSCVLGSCGFGLGIQSSICPSSPNFPYWLHKELVQKRKRWSHVKKDQWSYREVQFSKAWICVFFLFSHCPLGSGLC